MVLAQMQMQNWLDLLKKVLKNIFLKMILLIP